MQWMGDNSGRGGRGRGGYRGKGGGRYGGRNYNDTRGYNQGDGNGVQTEHPAYDICKFYVRGGNCRNGDKCRYVHNLVVVAFTIPAHTQPIKSIGVLTMPDGPKILTGSSDSTVKVWNLATEIPSQEISIPTTGKVQQIQVTAPTILWSVDEPLNADQPDMTVGVVYLFNPNDMTTVGIKRSEEMPYTHPFGSILSFTTAVIEGVTYVITSGGEGAIRTWRFDVATGNFVHLALLEGHTRAITCLLLHDTLLWSGSVDRTLRVWEVGTGKCVGVITAAAGGSGHTDAVSCLEFIPAAASTGAPTATEAYIASGGAEGAVKLWKPTGEFVHSVNHSSFVSALKFFQDSYGGVQSLIIGLLDGSIIIRSCLSMAVLIHLDSSICHTKAIWSIAILGQSCFATGGDDGNLIVWRVEKALADK